jgi:hypothetical protein
MGLGGQRNIPASLPPGRDPTPIVHEAGWTQGRSRRVRSISPSPEFDPRTVQPVATGYTDYTIPAHEFL